jgi:hypothetical protein
MVRLFSTSTMPSMLRMRLFCHFVASIEVTAYAAMARASCMLVTPAV